MRARRHLSAIAAFVLLALGVTWPLPLHLTTHLPGAPTGDTGVYVWNVWIFRHELLRHAQFPLFTDHIFALTNGVNLSAHNYTVFADLLGLALIPIFGVVGAFNVIYLLLITGTAYATFLLVRRVTGGATLEAWIGGAVFAASPVLIARGTAHFSLVAAMPLPLFLLCLMRALDTRRTRDAVLAGLVLGWAGYCDVYFPIYCALMGGVILFAHRWRIERASGAYGSRRLAHVVSGVLVGLGCLVGWRLWTGEATATIFGVAVRVRTLYTPVFVLTVLALVRAQLAWRVKLVARPGALTARQLATLIGMAASAAAAVLSPVLIALAQRLADGRFPNTPIYWRSSPIGLDLIELVLPNPNHPWFGERMREWITAYRPDAFPEYVGSLPLVGIAVVLLTAWKQRGAIPRVWIGFTAAFTLLALGPFVQIARVNTYIPGPWALLRYVPLIDFARAPSRFVIVAFLGFSICLAFALRAVRRASPRYPRAAMAAIAALLALELLPSPRPLFDAAVPSVYATIRADADESRRVLELPAGVRDGTSSLGDFNASAQYFQTVHRKPLIGGYVSRVSERRRSAYGDIPAIAVLFALSERTPVPEAVIRQILSTKHDFVASSCIGYVVIDRARATPELRSFAIELFDLVPIGDDGGRELFLVPARGRTGACGPPALPAPVTGR
jgi:hypothetical protein